MYDSIYMKSQHIQSHRNTKQIGGYQGLEEGGSDGVSFSSDKNVLELDRNDGFTTL